MIRKLETDEEKKEFVDYAIDVLIQLYVNGFNYDYAIEEIYEKLLRYASKDKMKRILNVFSYLYKDLDISQKFDPEIFTLYYDEPDQEKAKSYVIYDLYCEYKISVDELFKLHDMFSQKSDYLYIEPLNLLSTISKN